jgi:membrane protein
MTSSPLASTAERAATHWRAQMARLVETLQRWPYLDTVVTLRQRFREDRLGLTAGSLTFTTLISLVPLITVMLAAFAAFPMFASFQEALQKYFCRASCRT